MSIKLLFLDTISEYGHNGQESGHNGVYVYTKSPKMDIGVDLFTVMRITRGYYKQHPARLAREEPLCKSLVHQCR